MKTEKYTLLLFLPLFMFSLFDFTKKKSLNPPLLSYELPVLGVDVINNLCQVHETDETGF